MVVTQDEDTWQVGILKIKKKWDNVKVVQHLGNTYSGRNFVQSRGDFRNKVKGNQNLLTE